MMRVLRIGTQMTRRFAAVLLLFAIFAPMRARAASPGSSVTPPAVSRVPVQTSRGEFSLLVYPPARPDPALPLVLLSSGEGGWRSFDGVLAGMFNERGYWVGGVDTMKYFWTPQDDRSRLGDDMRAFAASLAAAAGRPAASPLLLAGYSFGADLAPWIAGAGGWDGRVRGLVMLGPDATGSLEFRVSELMGFSQTDHVFSVADAIAPIDGLPILLLHGGADSGSDAPALARVARPPGARGRMRLAVVDGADHHFTGHEAELRRALGEGLLWIGQAAP
jgi:type IV secretory pathway VirJ component